MSWDRGIFNGSDGTGQGKGMLNDGSNAAVDVGMG